jgi:tetratricopeptide (TPR) repeat protein
MVKAAWHEPEDVPTDVKPLGEFAGGVFVGREPALHALRAALADATSGRLRLVLLVGEPGIGKTRTAEELAAQARRRQARVLWGRCHEGEGAPAYWPWLQIIRTYVDDRATDVWAAAMGCGAAVIAQVVPEVRERLAGLPESPSLGPAQARFRLFDAMAGFFRNAARSEILVLVLDDLHWADTPSLLLLQFLVRQIREAKLLVVGTYRDVELGRHHPLARTLGDLAREYLTERILLRGLTMQDTGLFMQATTGVKAPEALVRAVHAQTEGNPFFVSETVRLLASDGGLERAADVRSWTLAIPQGVREVIGRRLDRLSPQCNEVLTIASVMGREFELEMLGRVSEMESVRLLPILEEALAARVIAGAPSSAGQFSFAHTLVRETLYEELTRARRIALHRRLGEVIETVHAVQPDLHLAELAYHFFEASFADGDATKAVHYARCAGDRARTLLAYEDAAGHYERALQALDLKGPGDPMLRGELLLALGEAQHGAGVPDRAKAACLAAAGVARRCGAPELLARAALGYGRSGLVAIELGTFDEPLIRLLEEALGALEADDSGLRARVLGNLAMALYWSPSRERRASLSRQAVDMARRVGDPATLAEALASMHFALWGPESTQEQLAIAREIVQLSEQVGDVEMALQGRVWEIATLLELGDVTTANTEIAAYTRRAEELRQPRYLSFAASWRITRALLEGRFDDAQELIEAGLGSTQARVDQAFRQTLGTQAFVLYREKGRLEELEPAITEFLDRYTAIPGWRCVLANLYGHVGREAEARREFERVAANDFRALPEDLTWFFVVSLLAEPCAFLRDAKRAAVLYELLLPFARRHVVLSAAVCLGSASRYLGLLADTMGRWEDAARHFEEAIAMNASIGARPWLAYCQYEQAVLLARRGDAASIEQARALAARALESARALGMNALLERAHGSGIPAAPPPAADVPPTDGNEFRCEGEYWTMVYRGTLVRLRDAKGLHHIACLLRHPGRPLSCGDLVAGAPGSFPGGEVDGAGPALDARAKADYRHRLAELREELAEAERFNDLGRAARVRGEIELLTDQLRAAVGLGGRDRKLASQAERARLQVTQAIRAAIKKVGRTHPALAEHLAVTVRTGYQCVYVPGPAQPAWRF